MVATITTFVFILTLAMIFSSSSSAVSATQAPSSSPPIPTCTEELVMFSPCLPYVSAPPNNMSETPDPICCSVFTSSVHFSAGNCLCYLLRQPMILGFPLDRSRLISLSQICTDQNSDESFESLCSVSESPELPPLQSIQFTNPFVSGNHDSASPPSVGLAPEVSPSSDQFSPETATIAPPPPPDSQYISSNSQKIRNFWFQSTIIMTFATSILTRI
ncbi:Bifunctional inhibitor/plant lipid transfer protein/seed storage helical domain superfamily [Arabidopsis thaliana x Arabidopsis arenosa]|uniref:Bifunctional inhibitor/plant lipid transfer protein/seed storage helical domain superfamily n=1 Tax=Arabidopsis thaliana x Arabidopsis arenosa TaxID=1240361 RepID=A0A8T1Y6T2_9BRAS|nr:Bifunctional inhibitor/plant lipid transfer protein/seed storage helical domain superfamily [Arabidopsis thaliana x Arabidopsis arenosa]